MHTNTHQDIPLTHPELSHSVTANYSIMLVVLEGSARPTGTWAQWACRVHSDSVCVCLCVSVGLIQARVALIWVRLHMDLIGWEIIIYQERKWWREKWKNAVQTDLRKQYTKKHQPLLHKWLFLSVLWHFSNASHENAACLFLWFLFTAPALHFLSDPQKTETYLALATRRLSLKRKRCLSWVCRPVFSCAWAWPKKRRAGHSATKAWTRGHDSGLTGARQLSLRTEKHNKTRLINRK